MQAAKIPDKTGPKGEVRYVRVSPREAGRRIDNYLTGLLRDIPKTRIYRMLRKGEVRVNSGRVKQDYRLQEEDVIRIPPVFGENRSGQGRPPSPSVRIQNLLRESVIYEDTFLLAINKPEGMAVHAGSGEQYGVIEILRALRHDCETLELVHRLDKLTSGCLLLAKDHRYLRELHALLRHHQVQKRYIALLYGRVPPAFEISLPLLKNELQSGERMVQVNVAGKDARTVFHLVSHFNGASLVHVDICTGRTHQIRVHAAHYGHPVAGDPKYGDRIFNRELRKAGLHRMFLHAESLTFPLPQSDKTITIKAPLPDDLHVFLEQFSRNHAKKQD